MLPSNKDLRKRHERIAKWAKLLNGKGYLPEKKLMQMLRSALRQQWMHSPVKLLKLEEAAYPDMNANTRTKWLVKCECCGESFKKGDVEIDHIHGGHSLKSLDDLQEFYMNVLDVCADDLQILCKECHSIKTFMEQHPGMTREEAVLEKKVIAWFKRYPKAAEQQRQLGYAGKDCTNREQREAVVRETLRGDMK